MTPSEALLENFSTWQMHSWIDACKTSEGGSPRVAPDGGQRLERGAFKKNTVKSFGQIIATYSCRLVTLAWWFRIREFSAKCPNNSGSGVSQFSPESFGNSLKSLEFHCYSWAGAKGISLRGGGGGMGVYIVTKIFNESAYRNDKNNNKCYIPFCILVVWSIGILVNDFLWFRYKYVEFHSLHNRNNQFFFTAPFISPPGPWGFSRWKPPQWKRNLHSMPWERWSLTKKSLEHGQNKNHGWNNWTLFVFVPSCSGWNSFIDFGVQCSLLNDHQIWMMGCWNYTCKWAIFWT